MLHRDQSTHEKGDGDDNNDGDDGIGERAGPLRFGSAGRMLGAAAIVSYCSKPRMATKFG